MNDSKNKGILNLFKIIANISVILLILIGHTLPGKQYLNFKQKDLIGISGYIVKKYPYPRLYF